MSLCVLVIHAFFGVLLWGLVEFGDFVFTVGFKLQGVEGFFELSFRIRVMKAKMDGGSSRS